MKRTKCILWNIGLLFLFISCGRSTDTSTSIPKVKIDTVAQANERIYLQFPGKVKAAQDVNLAFRVSGTIRKIYVKEGSRVRAGQLLADLDPTDYQVQLDATEAQYRQIKAEAERVIALYEDQGTTPNDYDKAVYGLKQITAKYKHHKDELAYTRLYAPFDGYIQSKLFEAHETVGAGMPVLSMIGNGLPEVVINLPANEYINRDKFSDYSCTFDLYPDRTYPLKLISVTPKANANQLYTMRLQLTSQSAPLPSPGMNTMVTIRSQADTTVPYQIPGGAILKEGNEAKVFIYSPSKGTIHLRPVTLVRLLSDGQTIITSSQIKEGDLIVVTGVHHLKDGEKVECLPQISNTNIGGML